MPINAITQRPFPLIPELPPLDTQPSKVVKGSPFIAPEYVGSTIKPSASKEQERDLRPKLEAPDTEKLKTCDGMNHKLVHEVGDAEYMLMQSLLQCMNDQRENIEEGSLISGHALKLSQAAKKTLNEEYFHKVDEMIRKRKQSWILNWVQKVFGGIFFAGGVASVGVLIATGGAALPPLLVAANAIAGVSTGSTKIAQGVVDYQLSKKQGEIKQLQLEQTLKQRVIREEIGKMDKSMQAVSDNWSRMRQVLEAYQDASATFTKG